jgi:hypothetical protein
VYQGLTEHLLFVCAGTEDALKLEVEALAKLEKIASLSAPTSASASGSPADNRPILEKFHGARDKHIFRILATISSPTHSASARARAFDELPKRTKSLGEQTSTWVKMLARRCAMGNFLNVEVVNHCILLAQECFHAGDMDGCMSFLSCVKMTSEIFPAVCANKEGFGNLIELFSECQRSVSGKKRKSDERSEIITLLSSVLAAAAPARSEKSTNVSLSRCTCLPVINKYARSCLTTTIPSLFCFSGIDRRRRESSAFGPLHKGRDS